MNFLQEINRLKDELVKVREELAESKAITDREVAIRDGKYEHVNSVQERKYVGSLAGGKSLRTGFFCFSTSDMHSS